MAEAGARRRRSNWSIKFAGLDALRGDAIFRFNVSLLGQNQEEHVATLSIPVPAAGDGIQGMMHRGHDQMREALLAMAEQLEVQRDAYKEKAGIPFSANSK